MMKHKKMYSILFMLAILLSVLQPITFAQPTPRALWLEAEHFSVPEGGSYTVLQSPSASGGAYLASGGKETLATVSKTFTVSASGDYDFKILSTKVAGHLSTASYSIDGGASTAITQTIGNSVYTVSGKFTDNTNQDMVWMNIGTIPLLQGTHTITLSSGKRSFNDKIIHGFDALAIVPKSWNWTPDGIKEPSAYNIENFSLTGSIVPNGTISATATVSDVSGQAENFMLVTAFYQGERLSRVTMDTKPCGNQTTYQTSIPLPSEVEDSFVKAFLWDSAMQGKQLIKKPTMDWLDFTVDVPKDREPVILQLSDTQIIDAGQQRYQDRLDSVLSSYYATENMEDRCFGYIQETVSATNPDLILITGDLVYGEFDDAGTSFLSLVSFMESLDVPWAPVFGNHDNESNMGADWQCQQLESAENCLFRQRTLTGNGNYNIGITQGGELKRVIFMLDSNGCGAMSEATAANEHSTTGTGFGADQIAWFTETAQNLKQDCPDLKFTFACHIQPKIFATAYAKYGYDDAGTNLPIDIDKIESAADGDFGYIGKRLKGPWDSDNTVYRTIKELGTDSILVGHEHCNSASVVYDGIRFQFGQKSSTYDRANYKKPDGTIAASYSDIGEPIIGGTVLKLSPETGVICDSYIYYCDTTEEGGTTPSEPSVPVGGLGFENGDISADSYIKIETTTLDGVSTYKCTAQSQGKVYIKTSLIAENDTFSFDAMVPETSTGILQGVGDFAIRVKPSNLEPATDGYQNGYIAYSISSSNQNISFVRGQWKTFTVDISKIGENCDQFAFLIPTGNTLYLKNVRVS